MPTLPGFNRNIVLAIAISASVALTSGCTTTGGNQTTDPEEKVFAEFPIDDVMEAGDAALAANELERAAFIYMQALDMEQSAETWYKIGLVKGRLGDRNYARQALSKALEMDPEHAGAHQELGLTFMAMGDTGQATHHFRKATSLNENLWRSWNALGVIADIEKRYTAAIDNYMSALIGNPNSAVVMNNIGYSYYLSGDLQEATRWLGRAIMSDPEYKPAVKNLALLYAREGWYQEAVKTFAKAVDKPQAYNDTGYIAMRNGDYDQASELLAQAIRLSPTYYAKAYENLEMVKSEIKKSRREETDGPALSNVEEVVFPDGEDPKFKSVMPRALNVRAAPSADSRIISFLKTGDEVQIIMSRPGWAFVNYRPRNSRSNLTGWVNSDYLTGTEGLQLETTANSSAKQQDQQAAADRASDNESVIVESVADSATTTAAVSASEATPAAPVADLKSGEQAAIPQEPAVAPAEAGDAAASGGNDFIKSVDAVCEPEPGSRHTDPDDRSCMGVSAANKE